MNKDDLIAKGFHKLDSNLLDDRAPNINWGDIYLGKRKDLKRSTEDSPYFWNESDRRKYAEKLASTMNHAAYLIQNERNQLNDLCEKKELLLEQMAGSMRTNDEVLQQEITKMNVERQTYNNQVIWLKDKVRELKHGNHD